MIDWPRKKVADLIDGLTAGVSVRSTDGRGYGPAVLKTSAVDQGRFVPDEVKTILPADRQRARCNPMAGSLIISRMNTPAMVGDVGYVRSDYPNLFLPDRLWLARSKRGSRTDMRWLTYLFASEPGAALLHGLASGTSMSMQSIPKDRVLELEIHTPPPVEQRAIGDALESTDDLIATLERLIAKKQAIKQGMMQELLTGRTRLPGFTGPWSDASVGSVAVVTMGQSPPGASYNTDGYGTPLIQGNADIRARSTFDRLWTTAPTKQCAAGDVLLTVRAPVGYTAVAAKDSCLGRGVCALSAGADNRFLFHAFVYAEPKWMLYEQGSTFTAVNSNEVRSFVLAWPTDRAERVAIGEVLDDMDSELRALRQRHVKARAVKQGMMQQLLAGRTRLPVNVEVSA